MKISVILLFVFIMLFAYMEKASSVTSNLKEIYAPRETAIAELSGTILEQITKEQVKLKRGHVDVAFDYDIKKLGDKYYFWFIAPNSQNSYTFTIEDMIVFDNGENKVMDYQESFSVEGESVDYSIKPGFVLSDKDFEITATVYEDFNKVINSDFPETREFELKPGENKLKFSIEKVSGAKFVPIKIGRYNVPGYILGNYSYGLNARANQSLPGNISNTNDSVIEINESEEPPPLYIQKEELLFEFFPKIIEINYIEGGKLPVYQIGIINKGRNIDRIFFQYNNDIFSILTGENETINSNETKYFNLSLKNAEGDMKEVVTAKSENSSSYLLVKLKSVKNESESGAKYFKSNTTGGKEMYYCSELLGVKCSADEICSGEEVNSLDNLCCIGKCEKEPASSGKSWAGYLIIGIVILVILIIFFKYRKSKSGSGSPIPKKIFDIEKNLP